MNKAEIVSEVAKRNNLKRKEVLDVIDTMLSVVEEELVAGNEVTLVDFGIFEIRERKERMGVDPNTQKPILIKKRLLPAFRPSRGLKVKVNTKN